MDSEIEKRDEQIVKLQEELNLAKGSALPYIQLTKEITSSYPGIKEVYMAQGANIKADSLTVVPYVFVMVTCEQELAEEENLRLNEWLKIRLNTEKVILIQQ